MLDLLQHAPLVIGVLDLLHLDHLGLLQHLDGIEALVVLGLNEMHSPEATRAERPLDGEVGQRVLALGDTGLVERLSLELHGAAILRGRLVRASVVGVYQILYAGDIVRWRRVGLRTGAKLLLLRLLLLLGVGGVHRVGRLAVCGRRGRGRGAGVACGVGERLVRLGLVEVEGARLARCRGRDGRVAVLDGRSRRVEVLGAVRVLRPLLLEEAQSRHWRGGSRNAAALPCLFLDAAPAISASSGQECVGSSGRYWAAQRAAIDALRVRADARTCTGAG